MPRDKLQSPTQEEMAAFDASIATQGFARVFVPIEYNVKLNDILHRNDQQYRVVAINEYCGSECSKQVIFEPILAEIFDRPLSYLPENPVKTLRKFVDEMGLDRERIDEASFKAAEYAASKFLKEAFEDIDNPHKARIRAEVEAMDWPEVIDG